jgi:hypothetical protein
LRLASGVNAERDAGASGDAFPRWSVGTIKAEIAFGRFFISCFYPVLLHQRLT